MNVSSQDADEVAVRYDDRSDDPNDDPEVDDVVVLVEVEVGRRCCR